MKEIFDLIKQTHPLKNDSAKRLKEIIEIDIYPPKYKLVEIGKKTTHFYFLFSGIARAYTISKDGKESNISLFYEQTYLSAYPSLVSTKPSTITIECLTKCKIAKCSYSEFMKLTGSAIDLNLAYIKSIEKLIIANEKRDVELATLSATERYLALKSRVQNIDNLISQKNIALHLGITPVQLSRLKKKLFAS